MGVGEQTGGPNSPPEVGPRPRPRPRHSRAPHTHICAAAPRRAIMMTGDMVAAAAAGGGGGGEVTIVILIPLALVLVVHRTARLAVVTNIMPVPA